jgi:hypothetical protein
LFPLKIKFNKENVINSKSKLIRKEPMPREMAADACLAIFLKNYIYFFGILLYFLVRKLKRKKMNKTKRKN